MTTAGLVFGTPGYLAPERLAGQPASAATDVWSVGVVCWEALAGRRAFPADTPIAVAMAVMTTDLPPIASIRPDGRWRTLAAGGRQRPCFGGIRPGAGRPPNACATSCSASSTPARRHAQSVCDHRCSIPPAHDSPHCRSTRPDPRQDALGRSPTAVLAVLAVLLLAAIAAVTAVLIRDRGTSSGTGQTSSQTSTTVPASTAPPTTSAPATTTAPSTTPAPTTSTLAPTTTSEPTPPSAASSHVDVDVDPADHAGDDLIPRSARRRPRRRSPGPVRQGPRQLRAPAHRPPFHRVCSGGRDERRSRCPPPELRPLRSSVCSVGPVIGASGTGARPPELSRFHRVCTGGRDRPAERAENGLFTATRAHSILAH